MRHGILASFQRRTLTVKGVFLCHIFCDVEINVTYMQ